MLFVAMHRECSIYLWFEPSTYCVCMTVECKATIAIVWCQVKTFNTFQSILKAKWEVKLTMWIACNMAGLPDAFLRWLNSSVDYSKLFQVPNCVILLGLICMLAGNCVSRIGHTNIVKLLMGSRLCYQWSLSKVSYLGANNYEASWSMTLSPVQQGRLTMATVNEFWLVK